MPDSRLRPRLAAEATRATARASRLLGLGSGSTIGGRVGLFVDGGLLGELGRHRSIALISGTNGKTTTTRLLASALATLGEVATSSAGANMSAGLVSALATQPGARVAALEVDEAFLDRACRELAPLVVVLLNLSRDQLDRISEVRLLAQRWRDALGSSSATIVANADDPLVVFAARDCRSVIWVATGSLWHQDAYHCPICDARIDYHESDERPSWSCECGFAQPDPDAIVRDGRVRFEDGREFSLPQSLPGRFNAANAAMAAIAASCFGIEIGHALDQAGAVSDVAGRFARIDFGSGVVRLLLAKNPAGWTELLELLRHENRPVVIGINAHVVDGHDPSWLWDVPFELLAERSVVATGERRLDLGVRLRHAGVEHSVIRDQLAALSNLGVREIDYVGNYTAFQDLRRNLSARRSSLPKAVHQRAVLRTQTATATATATVRSTSDLRVVVVHPDLLGTYGDSGNGVVLANRAAWRSQRVELIHAPSDVPLPADGDIYLLGGGEDGPQARSAQRLRDGALARAVERGAVVFAVCAGFQIIGTSFPSTSDDVEGVGLLDVRTVRRDGPRAVGEVIAVRNDPLFGTTIPRLTGFENHQSSTLLGGAVEPLALVEEGIGNGEGALEGAVSGRVIGTYLHGPALARNQVLADVLIGLVLGGKLEPLDDEEEQALRAERFGRLARSRGRDRRQIRVLTRK